MSEKWIHGYPESINHDSPVNHPYKLAMWWGGAYLISDTLKCDIHSPIVHPHPPIVSPMISTVLSPFKQGLVSLPGMASIAADKWLIPITPCPPAAPWLERTCEDGAVIAVQTKKLQMCNSVITQKHWKPCWKQDRHQNWFKQFINLSNENCDISREYAKNMWLRDARCDGSRRNMFGEVSPCRSWMVLPHLDENPGDPGEM